MVVGMNISSNKVFFFFGFFALSFFSFINANELLSETQMNAVDNVMIVKREDVPELELVVLHLKNGMKVCLKKTASDDEIVVRLTAAGGYTSLPESQRTSGQYASQVAIRSGIGKYNFDLLHAILYDHSIEFNSEVQPFCRYVEGTAFKGEVEILMNLINLFFTQHHFTEHSFNKVMQKAKEKVFHQSKKSYRGFADNYMDFNAPSISAFRGVTVKDIEKADYLTAKKFFESSFKDPSEFACVIAGTFDVDKMIDLIEKYLAIIPSASEERCFCKIPDFPPLQKGIRTKVVPCQSSNKESTTILTFPVIVDITEENFIAVENISQIMYIRLKKALRERYGMDSIVFDVTIEYPLYPCLGLPWIKIQYITPSKLTTSMGQAILSELEKLKNHPVTKEEIALMNQKFKKTQLLHNKDNYYWVMLLSNYAMGNWDLTKLPANLNPLEKEEKIQEGLQTYFSLDNYTIISAQQ